MCRCLHTYKRVMSCKWKISCLSHVPQRKDFVCLSFVSSDMSHVYRPTQSIMHVPLQSNRFQKSILLIVQYNYSKSCSRDFILQNLILRTRSCGTGFITQSSWLFHVHQTTLVWWKCCVPQLYQFRRDISGGPALKYFQMIHKRARILMCPHILVSHVPRM